MDLSSQSLARVAFESLTILSLTLSYIAMLSFFNLIASFRTSHRVRLFAVIESEGLYFDDAIVSACSQITSCFCVPICKDGEIL